MDQSMNRQSPVPAVIAGSLLAMSLFAASSAPAADATHGKSVFAAQCAMCHTATKGGAAILGPNLYGVVGRKAGAVVGYAYSKGMKAAGFIWTEERLENYLPAPKAMVAGTKMSYGGLKNPAQVADLATYLASLK